MKKNILFFFLSSFFLQFYACRHNAESYTKEQVDYTLHTKFNENYYQILPYNSLDSLFEKIKIEVPPIMQNHVLEAAYFHEHYSSYKDYLYFLDRIEAEFPSDSTTGFSQLMRGNIFIHTMQFDTAEICLRDCYNLSIKAKRKVRASDAQYNIGALLAKKGDYPEGIRLLMDAYKVSKSLEPMDGGRSLNICMALARAYKGIEDHRMSLYWHNVAWEYNRIETKDGIKPTVVVAIGMGEDYKNLKMLDSAKIMLDTATWVANKFKDEATKPLILFERSAMDVASGNCDFAVKNYMYLREYDYYLDFPEELSKLNKGLGDAYFCLGKLDSAVYYYDKALFTPDTVVISKIHLQLAKVFERKNNVELALEHERIGNALYGHIITSNKEKRMARMQAENDVKVAIEAMEYNKKMTKYAYFLSFVILGIVVFFILYRNKKKQQQILANEKALAEARENKSASDLSQAKITLKMQALIIEESEQLLELKNTLIENLEEKVNYQTIYEQQNSNAAILRDLRILTNEDWINFKNLFDTKFPTFNTKLKKELPSLTAAEQRLFLLIKIDFGSDDIARVLGISNTSVYTSRYRLRKKMGLGEDGDLDEYIKNF